MSIWLQRLARWYLDIPCLCTNLRAFSDGHMDEDPDKYVGLDIFTVNQEWFYDTVLEKLLDTNVNIDVSFTDDGSGLVFYIDWNVLGIWSGLYYTH